jgi:hypothetical protein
VAVLAAPSLLNQQINLDVARTFVNKKSRQLPQALLGLAESAAASAFARQATADKPAAASVT